VDPVEFRLDLSGVSYVGQPPRRAPMATLPSHNPFPSTAMHKVFNLNNIVRLITDNIPHGELKSAVALACCCESISGPALDSLWRRQTDLGTLLVRLPPPTWKVVNNEFVSVPSSRVAVNLGLTQTQDFLLEPSEDQWARFSTYARRMRTITEPRAFLPSQAAVQLLRTRFSTHRMLPLLRSLEWLLVPSARLQSCVPLLVSPHLADIRLHFEENTPERCLPIMRTLIEASGSLESVEIIPEFSSPEMQDAVSTLLLSCNPNLLRKFCVASPISEAALLHAAQLLELQEFSLRGGTPGLSDPLPLTIFPSLRTLLISMGALPTWLEVLRHVQSKRLVDLSIDFTVGTGDLSTISTHLQYSGIHRTLTVLRLCPADGWILNRAAITPLLVLGELTTLDIFAVCERELCGFSLSDEDIERLVKAMPKLVNLSLGTPCSAQARDDLTVKSLLAIAKHSKALQFLTMHINCESIVMSAHEREFPGLFDFHTRPPSEAIPSDYDGCPLRSVRFGSSPIPVDDEGGIILALTLIRLFPRLAQVLWHPSEQESPWRSVNILVYEHHRVWRNLVAFGESVHVHPCDIELMVPQPISLPSSCKFPSFFTIPRIVLPITYTSSA
jgi:hypothetical protein